MILRSLLALFVVSCSAATSEPAPAPAPSPVDSVSDDCSVACTRYRALKCPEGEPTPEGAPCEDWCRAAESDGIDIVGPRTCTRTASSCALVASCSG